MKKIISWIVAFAAAILVFLLLWQLILGTIKLIFNIGFILVIVICVIIIAVPIYMIISKKFIK